MPASTIERRTIIDSETGNVITETETTYNVIPATDEPEYVKLYIRAWCEFKGLCQLRPADKDVLVHLLPSMTYSKSGQLVYTNIAMKRRICEECGIKMNTCNAALQHLLHAGVLKRVDTATYQVNPELVGRGSWQDIKRLRATFNIIGPQAGTVDVDTD